jgi:hypothetical protein
MRKDIEVVSEDRCDMCNSGDYPGIYSLCQPCLDRYNLPPAPKPAPTEKMSGIDEWVDDLWCNLLFWRHEIASIPLTVAIIVILYHFW